MRKRRILWLLLAIILLPLSAEGQREIYGVSKYGEFDKRKIHVDETYAMLYEVYEQSTIEGMVRDVVYSMLKACEKEFGNPSTPQCSCKYPSGLMVYRSVRTPMARLSDYRSSPLARLRRRRKKPGYRGF